MNFGQAIEALKAGERVARRGWNGKGMFLYYVPANTYKAQTDIAKKYFGEDVPYRAYIAMKTVDNDVAVWTASQSDVLAEDWENADDLDVREAPFRRKQNGRKLLTWGSYGIF